MDLRKSDFRIDVQALRGVAVLLVLIYHSGLDLIDAGFLGVDMFFVVSGFLITGIVKRSIAKGSFSFAYFYTRRVRRLLPAAYVMLFATTLASALLLTSTQYHEFLTQLAGSVFFVANITLWQQTGYFATDAAFKPLLHMWSLAIEEQYYLLLPAFLFLTPRRWWVVLLAAGTVSSLALCLYVASHHPGVAFFLLPPRAWELGLGSLGAFIAGHPLAKRLAGPLALPAVAAIFLVPAFPLPGPHPGASALLICLATLAIILADERRGDGFLPVRLLARVGDFSYTLYLVHWPLFALTRAVYLSEAIPPALSFLLIFASIGVALVIYTLIEEPIRRSSFGGWRLAITAVASSLALLLLGWALGQTKTPPSVAGALLKPVVGLAGPGCFGDGIRFTGLCRESEAPEILVWGDSYSAHLVPGLRATTDRPLVQASKGHCSPYSNYVAVVESNERAWAEGCLQYNASVLDYISKTPSVQVVVLSGQYVRSLGDHSALAMTRVGGSYVPAELGLEATIGAQRDTVAAIRALGRRLVVISPTPPSPFDMGQCWERMAAGLPILGEHGDCIVYESSMPLERREFRAMLDGFAVEADVPVIRLDRFLCRNGKCPTQVSGRPLFKDVGHFTEEGSIFVGRKLGLGQRVWAVAR